MNASINVKATVAGSLFAAEQNAQIVELSLRLDKTRRKAVERLQEVSDALDALLEGHSLEDRLRPLLLAPLCQEEDALLQAFDRIRTRLLLFVPPATVEQLHAGLDLQLEDIRAQPSAMAAVPGAGYWIDEDSHSRLERAMNASSLMASLDDQIGRTAAISHESLAATAHYVADDLEKVLAGAVFVLGARKGRDA